jgi:hypothetical protein
VIRTVLCLPTRQGVPHGQTESGGSVLAVNAGSRGPSLNSHRSGIVLMRNLVSLTEHSVFLSDWFKTFFMADSENLGKGEIQESNSCEFPV